MQLTALENTPIDCTAYVSDEFLKKHGFQKGRFHGISAELRKSLEQKLDFSKTTGGSAANVCHGFVNLGMAAVFIGSVGDDDNGKFCANELGKAGIALYLHEKKGHNGVCMVLVTPDKERTFAVNMGKSSSLLPWEFDYASVAGSDFFHTTAYALDSMYRTVKQAMRIAKKNKVKVSFDLASVKSIQRHRERIAHLLENYVDIVFANKEEAMEYTGENEIRKAMLNEKLRYCGRHSNKEHLVVVKCGSQGAGIYSDAIWGREHGAFAKIPAYKVSEVKNTNGAGDAFAAGFLYGIAKGHEFVRAALIGAYYAARVVEVEPAKLPYRISNIEELI